MNDFTRNEIIRRWYEGQSMRGIAADLHLARETVKRAVDQHRRDRQGDPAAAAEPRKRRPSKIDPYEDQIGRLLGRYPRITVQTHSGRAPPRRLRRRLQHSLRTGVGVAGKQTGGDRSAV